MQKFIIPKQMILLIGLLLPTVWCIATNIGIADGLSGITINQGIFNIKPSAILSEMWFSR